MDEQKLNELTNKLQGIKQSNSQRDHRLSEINHLCMYSIIAKPSGLFSKRCPNDNVKLTKKDGGWRFKWYICPNCDYEYVETINTEM